jgi:hypothetical protein
MTGLDFVALGFILFSVFIITLGIIKIHTYPGIVARERRHPQADAIEVTSLLGLLVFPLWMGALIWAYSGALIGKMYVQQTPDADTKIDAATDTDDPNDADEA